MSDFETILKILVEGIGIIFIPIGGLAALAGIRLVWRRGSAIAPADLKQQLADMQTRIDELERRGLTSGEVSAQYNRLAELEERLDFAERLLAQRDAPGVLPGREPR